MKKQIIIDTDPGCDDAIALIITFNNLLKLDINLISTVGGNVSVENNTKNALFLVENFAPISIPVAIGEESSKEVDAKNVHGENGLGNVNIDLLKTHAISNAVECMYKTLMQTSEKTIIFSLGPVTNIALLLKTHPDCKEKIDYIFAMAGSLDGTGNITPFAEFNVYSNPEAFDFVAKSGVKIIFSPMQLGINCGIDKSNILTRKITSKKEQIIHDIIDGAFEPEHTNQFFIFDAQVPLGILHPELYDFKDCEFKINLNEETRGQTFITLTDHETNFKVQTPKDCKKIKQILLNELFK